jgi:hypothetical protein
MAVPASQRLLFKFNALSAGILNKCSLDGGFLFGRSKMLICTRDQDRAECVAPRKKKKRKEG